MAPHDTSQELSLADVFSGSLKFYADHFIPFLRLSVIGAIPGLVFQVAAVLYPEEVFGNLFLLWLVAMAVAFVFGGALVYAVRAAHERKESSFPDLIGEAFRRYWPLTGAFSLIFLANVVTAVLLSLAVKGYENHPLFMVGVAVLALYLVALWGMLYVDTVLAVFPFALLIDGAGVWGSFRRSVALTRGSFWFVMRGHVLYFAVFIAVSLPFLIGFRMMDAHEAVIAAVAEVILIVLFPFMVIYYFHIYRALADKAAEVIAIYDGNAPV